jgi:hypothetical protein
LLICSICALTLVIERLYSLREVRVAPPRLVDEVITVTRNGIPAADVVNKLAENSVLGTLLATGLRAIVAEPRLSEQSLRGAFESAGRAAVHRMERYLNALGTIASAAPLLGLMGTVIGMIEIFASAQRQQPGAARARHFRGAVQHGLRPDDRDPDVDVLPLLPRSGRRLHARHGTSRRPVGAAHPAHGHAARTPLTARPRPARCR